MEKLISETILFFEKLGSDFFENLKQLNIEPWQIFVDIALVSMLLYSLFILIKGSRTFHILLGIIILGALFLASKALSLIAVDWILNRFLTMLIVAIPIIFQQELRQGLERLGRTKRFFNRITKEIDRTIQEVAEAAKILAEKNTGALMVFEGEIPLKEFIQTGVLLDAKISKELLISIFDHHSPLHDGAVIIADNIIKSAASLLPHSMKEHTHEYGTRHKAALALSESTDAKIIAVSEEKGTISWIEKGEMQSKISKNQLIQLLGFLKPKKR